MPVGDGSGGREERRPARGGQGSDLVKTETNEGDKRGRRKGSLPAQLPGSEPCPPAIHIEAPLEDSGSDPVKTRIETNPIRSERSRRRGLLPTNIPLSQTSGPAMDTEAGPRFLLPLDPGVQDLPDARRPSLGVPGSDFVQTALKPTKEGRRGSFPFRIIRQFTDKLSRKRKGQTKPTEKTHKPKQDKKLKNREMFKNLRRKRRSTVTNKAPTCDIAHEDLFRQDFDYLFRPVDIERTPIGQFFDAELKRMERMLRFPEMVALAMTEYEFELFCQVPAEDYVTHVTQRIGLSPYRTAETPDASSSTSATVNDLTQRFRKVRRWVLEVLVCQPAIEHRQAVISCLLRVMEVCVLLGNTGTVLQILTGLRTPELQPFWHTLQDRKVNIPSLVKFCDDYLRPEPSQEYIETMARAIQTPTNKAVPFFAYLVNEIKAIRGEDNDTGTETGDDDMQCEDGVLDEIRTYQSQKELPETSDNVSHSTTSSASDLAEFHELKSNLPFGTRFLPVNAGIVARDLHLMHAGTTVVKLDSVRGTPQVVCLRLELDDRTLAWYKPDWSALKPNTTPKDFEFRSNPVPSIVRDRYRSELWVLDETDADGFVDLFVVKDVDTDSVNNPNADSVLYSYDITSDADPDDPQVYLTMVYGKTLAQNKVLTFLMPTSIWTIWSRGLGTLLGAYRKEGDLTDNWVKEQYIRLNVRKDSRAGPTPPEVVECFGGTEWSAAQKGSLEYGAYLTGTKLPENHSDLELSFKDFMDLWNNFSVGIRDDLSTVFRKYASEEIPTTRKIKGGEIWDRKLEPAICKLMAHNGIGNNRAMINMCMTVDGFSKFLEEEQRECLSDDDVVEMIERFELDPSLGQKDLLSFEGFVNYMNSSGNSMINIEENDQDMSHPLSHYFINSSHNTYLTGHQFTGESSVEIYSTILIAGCRCVELDCWDGDDGWPIIFHGHTLTTKISFKNTLIAINKSAFVTSPYPVVLSIENHCSLDQQQKMARLFQEILGPRLVSEFLEEPDFSTDGRLPSPDDLKHKFLIKNKKLPDTDKEHRRGSLSSIASPDSGNGSDTGELWDEEDDDPPAYDTVKEYFRTPGQSNSDKTHNRTNRKRNRGIHKTLSFYQANVEEPREMGDRPPSFKETWSETEEDEPPREQGSSVLENIHFDLPDLPKRHIPAPSKPRKGRRASAHPLSFVDPQKSQEKCEVASYAAHKSSSARPRNKQFQRRKSFGDALSLADLASKECSDSDHISIEDEGVDWSRSDPRPIKRGSSEKKSEKEDGGRHQDIHKSSSTADLQDWRAEQRSSKKRKVHPDLSKLIIYTEAIRFNERWLNTFTRKKTLKGMSSCYQMSSVNEKSSEGLWSKKAILLRHHCESHLLRVYPAGTRLNSTNFTPWQHWAAGIQMVALNHQTECLEMQVNSAMFERAGGCGYVLKPRSMWDKEDSMYNWFNPFQKGHIGVHSYLNIHLVAGQYVHPQMHFKSSIYIDVEMYGIPADCKKYKTKVVEGNALNPIWDEHFEFEVVFPELAFLRMSVCTSAGLSIAQRTVPVVEIKEGYRQLALRSPTDRPLEVSSLLVCTRLKEGAVWKPPPLPLPSTGRRSSYDLCESLAQSNARRTTCPDIMHAPRRRSSRQSEDPVHAQRQATAMVLITISGVSLAPDGTTLIMAPQSITAKQLIQKAMKQEKRQEDPSDMVIFEKTEPVEETDDPDSGITLRAVGEDEIVHEVMESWKDAQHRDTDSSLVLFRREDAPSEGKSPTTPTYVYTVETASLGDGIGLTQVTAPQTVTTLELIKLVLDSDGRAEDPDGMALLEETVYEQADSPRSPDFISRVLRDEEAVYPVCQAWLDTELQGTTNSLVLRHKEQAQGQFEIYV